MAPERWFKAAARVCSSLWSSDSGAVAENHVDLKISHVYATSISEKWTDLPWELLFKHWLKSYRFARACSLFTHRWGKEKKSEYDKKTFDLPLFAPTLNSVCCILIIFQQRSNFPASIVPGTRARASNSPNVCSVMHVWNNNKISRANKKLNTNTFIFIISQQTYTSSCLSSPIISLSSIHFRQTLVHCSGLLLYFFLVFSPRQPPPNDDDVQYGSYRLGGRGGHRGSCATATPWIVENILQKIHRSRCQNCT